MGSTEYVYITHDKDTMNLTCIIPSQRGGPFNELINRVHLYQTLKRSYKYPIYICVYICTFTVLWRLGVLCIDLSREDLYNGGEDI